MAEMLPELLARTAAVLRATAAERPLAAEHLLDRADQCDAWSHYADRVTESACDDVRDACAEWLRMCGHE